MWEKTGEMYLCVALHCPCLSSDFCWFHSHKWTFWGISCRGQVIYIRYCTCNGRIPLLWQGKRLCFTHKSHLGNNMCCFFPSGCSAVNTSWSSLDQGYIKHLFHKIFKLHHRVNWRPANMTKKGSMFPKYTAEELQKIAKGTTPSNTHNAQEPEAIIQLLHLNHWETKKGKLLFNAIKPKNKCEFLLIYSISHWFQKFQLSRERKTFHWCLNVVMKL